MIHFFRRIRQKLITDGKLSKYLIYALGEIALVMIGILLALQVNNWNQIRINRSSTQYALSLMQEDLSNDQTQLRSLKAQTDTIITFASNFLHLFFGNRDDVENIPQSLWIATFEMTFQPHKNAYESMNRDGVLTHMDNELQQAIVEYYNLLENINEREATNNVYIQNIYEPYVTEHYSHLALYNIKEPNLSVLYQHDERSLPPYDPGGLFQDSRLELQMGGRYIQSIKASHLYEEAIEMAGLLSSKIDSFDRK